MRRGDCERPGNRLILARPALKLRMRIELAIALSLISAFICSPLFAEQFNSTGSPVASSNDAQAGEIQQIGFLNRFFHWDRENARNESRLGSELESRRTRPNRPLIFGTNPGASPKRTAALHFAEKGRRLLLGGAYQRALVYFEKALGLDANPYSTFTIIWPGLIIIWHTPKVVAVFGSGRNITHRSKGLDGRS